MATVEDEQAIRVGVDAGLADLPPALTERLILVALRTELGRALWEGFVAGQLARCPWLEGPVRFRPGQGAIVPRLPEADGRPA